MRKIYIQQIDSACGNWKYIYISVEYGYIPETGVANSKAILEISTSCITFACIFFSSAAQLLSFPVKSKIPINYMIVEVCESIY